MDSTEIPVYDGQKQSPAKNISSYTMGIQLLLDPSP
jgi:hypothetical protein